MSNLNYKQVENVSRRTWDVEAYQKRAQDRINNEGRGGTINNNDNASKNEELREEFVPAPMNASGPVLSNRAFLKARTDKVNSLNSKIGSVEIINPVAAATTTCKSVRSSDPLLSKESAVTKSGVGWHCKVCDCFLRDSHAYLDHINGRKHNRALGYSMRVSKTTKNDALSRLQRLVKEKKKTALDQLLEEEDDVGLTEIIQLKDEAMNRRKEERKRERKKRKKEKREAERKKDVDLIENDEDECIAIETTQDELEDQQMKAMMGFSDFGGKILQK